MKIIFSFKKRTVLILNTVLFFSVNSSAFSQQLYEFSATKYLMGTKIDISATHTSIDSMKKAIYYSFKEIERIQCLMSSSIDTSEIYMININSGIKPVKVSNETYSIIERSINYSRKYDGIFDITIGCITELWGFNSDNPVTKIPEQKVIDSLIQFVGYEKIVLNPADTTVFLPMKGMKIDLGGIAKGYAIDRAAEIMKKNGMKNFFINGGGDIYISGYKQENQKWNVGIMHPRKENSIIASMEITDAAIGTSGDYERFAIIDGKRYHHIFDTKTGYPVMVSESATAIVPTTEEAVVLSKILFIRGGEQYLEEKNNIPGLIIDSEGKLYYDKELFKEYNLRIIQ
jgi:thiamine biosynthesis lipoprotein